MSRKVNFKKFQYWISASKEKLKSLWEDMKGTKNVILSAFIVLLYIMGMFIFAAFVVALLFVGMALTCVLCIPFTVVYGAFLLCKGCYYRICASILERKLRRLE